MTAQIRSLVYSNLFAFAETPLILSRRDKDANIDKIESLSVRGHLTTMLDSSHSSKHHKNHIPVPGSDSLSLHPWLRMYPFSLFPFD